ncbi:hypothetical protein GM51_12335 [freshwater metagenome]|uniref:Peptidylamidoglycolate lyase n=1 Tax=freshwater metagenome TaxID=449393 RepID=A0A094PZK0_9ZZZZ
MSESTSHNPKLRKPDSIPQEINWKTLFSGNPKDGWMHSGIGILSDGHIVFESPGGRAFIVLNPEDETFVKVDVNAAVLHGITVVPNSSDDSFWICDPGGTSAAQVLLVNRKGEVLRTISRPNTKDGDAITWKPTTLAIVEEEGPYKGDIWIGDGYGESLVHRIKPDGRSETFDGSSTSLVFNCPHGIFIDTRGPQSFVVIADRRNKRIVFFTLSGEYVKSVSSESMIGPSSFAIRNDLLIVTDLYGAMLSVDLADNVEILIPSIKPERGEGWPNQIKNGETLAPDVIDGAVNSPHGVAVNLSGTVFFTEWYFGGRVVRIY